MTDLIARLRMGTQVSEFELRQEAADEIERLECQLAISKGKHTNAIAEIERLRTALERIANSGGYADELVREIAREALKDD